MLVCMYRSDLCARLLDLDRFCLLAPGHVIFNESEVEGLTRFDNLL